MKRYSCLLSLGVKQVSELEADTIKLLKPHKGKSKNPRTVTDPMEYMYLQNAYPNSGTIQFHGIEFLSHQNKRFSIEICFNV